MENTVLPSLPSTLRSAAAPESHRITLGSFRTRSPLRGSLPCDLLRHPSMRIFACFLVFVALMASFAGAHANQGNGRVGIHSALDGRWPDLVGRDAEEAKTIILHERPALNVQILPSGMMMKMDYNTNRVRLIVNDERKVIKCPTIG